MLRALARCLTVALSLGACTPQIPSGVFSCNTSEDCPKGLACAPDATCRVPDGFNRAGSDSSDGSATSATIETAGVTGSTLPDGAATPAAAGAASSTRAPAATPVSAGGGSAGSTGATERAGQAGMANATASAGSMSSNPNSIGKGGRCSAADQCATGYCTDGVCCESQCGICQQCGADGTCKALTSVEDLDTCATPYKCNAAGQCVVLVRDGLGCAESNVCHSNLCEDGRCCSERCGLCATCNGKTKPGTCTPIVGYDDVDGCSGDRSCSSESACLYIDQQMSVFRSDRGFYSNSWPFAQIIRFSTPGKLVEVRALAVCADPALPSVWLETVSASGEPSGTRLRSATLVDLDPRLDTAYQFNAIRLAMPLEVRTGDRIAVVVVGQPNIDCYVSINDGQTYAGGGLFGGVGPQDTTGWEALPGSMVFQALVER